MDNKDLVFIVTLSLFIIGVIGLVSAHDGYESNDSPLYENMNDSVDVTTNQYENVTYDGDCWDCLSPNKIIEIDT